MKLSQEHKLALKISFFLLFIVLTLSIFFQYLNSSGIVDFSGNRGSNKYIIFFISSIIIYFVSLKLAYLTTKPMKETNEKLKNYNHNLAHELKTPLAVLKSNLELLEISYDKDLLKSSFEEITSMENIINSLLFLAENSKNKGIEKINLKELFLKYSENKDIKIYNNDDFIIKGDKNLFEILLKNIIENGLKYSEDKKINIDIKKDEIIFSNTIKSTINREELDKYFDIFYKGLHGNNFGSYGIGLSIVKKICDIYDLKVILDSEGTVFRLIIKK